MYQLIYAIYRKIVSNERSRQTPGIARSTCIEADEAVQPLALKETARVAGKRNQVEGDAEISRGRPWFTRSGSIVEKGRQPIGHRADESGPGANSPVIGMRKQDSSRAVRDGAGCLESPN
jgi:hypothetical protein